MQRKDLEHFVTQWIASWNARDLEAVLKHYDDRIVFHSPKAAHIVGRGRVEGKEALRGYWTAALARIPKLRFVLEHFAWDESRSELFIVYITELNDSRSRACERIRFDGERIIDSEGLYGAPLA
jgi:steroid delta-isomerase